MVSQGESKGSDELRRLLLDAALELLKEPDTPLDLRKVAERAGKSRTAPYLVFGKGKSGGVMALRIAVAAEGARLMQEAMVEAYAPDEDPFASLQSVATAFLTFVEANPRLFRLMYGPEINAIARLGEGGFREHPEFQRLLEYRGGAGAVVTELIHEAQDRAVLPPDPPVETANDAAFQELPSVRYLQIAWATMIGVSVLREDDLLKAIDWDVSIEQGARLVAESVLGVDPGRAEEAARTFLEAQSLTQQGDAEDAAAALWESGALDLGGADVRFSKVAPGAAPDVTSLGMPPASPPPPTAAPPPSREEPAEAEVAAEERTADEPIVAEVAEAERAPAERAEETPSVEPTRMRRAGPGSAAGRTFERVFRALRPGGEAPEEREPERRPRRARAAEEGPSLSEVLDQYSGLRRATYSKGVLRGARILWIDDHPSWVASTAATFRHLGAYVTIVASTAEALRTLRSVEHGPRFQVILSDIARGPNPREGTDAIPAIRAVAPDVPIIFNIAKYDERLGVPEGAFGITNRLDELFHLVVDALEGRSTG